MSKFSISQLKEEYQQAGWELCEDKYKNLSTMMECKCPEGHICHLTYDKWRKYKMCPTCAAEAIYQKDNKEVLPKPAGTKRLLALDQATNVSGWAIFDNGQLTQYGVFSCPTGSPESRINLTKKWTRDMITNWRVDQVILEDIQLQNFDNQNMNTIGVTTYKTLSHLQGVLIDLLYENKIPYKLAHTGVWRKYNNIKGKSRADKKKSAQLLVEEFYQQKVTQDEADAICIGRYGLTLFKDLDFSTWV